METNYSAPLLTRIIHSYKPAVWHGQWYWHQWPLWLTLNDLKKVVYCLYPWVANRMNITWVVTLGWRHNGLDIVSNHQPRECLLSRLFGRRSKKTSKLRVTGLCAGNSPGTGEFPAQRASNAENVSIWWRHHEQAMNYQLETKMINAWKPPCLQT